MLNVKEKDKKAAPVVAELVEVDLPVTVAAVAPPAVEPTPAPLPRSAVGSGLTAKELDDMVREGYAALSIKEYPTAMPADLQGRVDARTKQNTDLTARFLGTDDAGLQSIIGTTVADVQRVTEKFREHLVTLADELQRGELTEHGYAARVHAIESQMMAVVDTAVFEPTQNKIAAHTKRYSEFVTVPMITPEQRLEATAIAAELPHLTLAHAIPRVAEVLRDAIKADNFGGVRALLPYLKSQLEQKGTPYYGSGDLYAMVQSMESCLTDWKHAVGKARLGQLQSLQADFEGFKQMVKEGKGDPSKAFGFNATDEWEPAADPTKPPRNRPGNQFVSGFVRAPMAAV